MSPLASDEALLGLATASTFLYQSSHIPSWILFAGYVAPLFTNFFVTTFITARIWIKTRRQSDFVSKPARHAAKTIIESGVIYFIVQLIVVVCIAMKLPAQSGVGFLAIQIYVRRFISSPLSPFSPAIGTVGNSTHTHYGRCELRVPLYNDRRQPLCHRASSDDTYKRQARLICHDPSFIRQLDRNR